MSLVGHSKKLAKFTNHKQIQLDYKHQPEVQFFVLLNRWRWTDSDFSGRWTGAPSGIAEDRSRTKRWEIAYSGSACLLKKQFVFKFLL